MNDKLSNDQGSPRKRKYSSMSRKHKDRAIDGAGLDSKKCIIENNNKKATLKLKSVFIKSDSHGRHIDKLLQNLVGPETEIEIACRPGAKLADVSCQTSTIKDPSCVVLIAGTNDIGAYEQQNIYRHLEDQMFNSQSSKLIVTTIPVRHDLPIDDSINAETVIVNAYLEELCFRHKVEIVDFNQIDRNYFTKHGMHLSMEGKKVLARLVLLGLKKIDEPDTLDHLPGYTEVTTLPDDLFVKAVRESDKGNTIAKLPDFDDEKGKKSNQDTPNTTQRDLSFGSLSSSDLYTQTINMLNHAIIDSARESVCGNEIFTITGDSFFYEEWISDQGNNSNLAVDYIFCTARESNKHHKVTDVPMDPFFETIKYSNKVDEGTNGPGESIVDLGSEYGQGNEISTLQEDSIVDAVKETDLGNMVSALTDDSIVNTVKESDTVYEDTFVLLDSFVDSGSKCDQYKSLISSPPGGPIIDAVIECDQDPFGNDSDQSNNIYTLQAASIVDFVCEPDTSSQVNILPGDITHDSMTKSDHYAESLFIDDLKDSTQCAQLNNVTDYSLGLDVWESGQDTLTLPDDSMNKAVVQSYQCLPLSTPPDDSVDAPVRDSDQHSLFTTVPDDSVCVPVMETDQHSLSITLPDDAYGVTVSESDHRYFSITLPDDSDGVHVNKSYQNSLSTAHTEDSLYVSMRTLDQYASTNSQPDNPLSVSVRQSDQHNLLTTLSDDVFGVLLRESNQSLTTSLQDDNICVSVRKSDQHNLLTILSDDVFGVLLRESNQSLYTTLPDDNICVSVRESDQHNLLTTLSDDVFGVLLRESNQSLTTMLPDDNICVSVRKSDRHNLPTTLSDDVFGVLLRESNQSLTTTLPDDNICVSVRKSDQHNLLTTLSDDVFGVLLRESNQSLTTTLPDDNICVPVRKSDQCLSTTTLPDLIVHYSDHSIIDTMGQSNQTNRFISQIDESIGDTLGEFDQSYTSITLPDVVVYNADTVVDPKIQCNQVTQLTTVYHSSCGSVKELDLDTPPTTLPTEELILDNGNKSDQDNLDEAFNEISKEYEKNSQRLCICSCTLL